MTSRAISTITHGDSAEPIEVRIVRKWISHAFNNECCYLFVDLAMHLITNYVVLNKSLQTLEQRDIFQIHPLR
ncbi:hypothetical protein HanHA300_Chr08g0297381 [Helianthus annuus]|nr:hypothetical protein HanHA300_Chr08g0297381 [Helianthus annuus]KAJ0555103.1 hypothetical protein HanHA89_Chr08g0315881 [Helianthus annuus]KAJ0720670.1 hypothetical protein HanLR1_Chr08g0296241 [Helianthus annuus]